MPTAAHYISNSTPARSPRDVEDVFIKCDVEGAELLVLKGAANTLSRHKPILLLEIVDVFLKRQGHSLAEMDQFSRDHGYAFYVMENNGLMPTDRLHNMRNNFLIPK